jgi:hypothetical protein
MKALIIILLLLFPTISQAEQIIRDRSGSGIYTKQIQGGQIIYRDRSGSVVATENIHGNQRFHQRDRTKAPIRD